MTYAIAYCLFRLEDARRFAKIEHDTSGIERWTKELEKASK